MARQKTNNGEHCVLDEGRTGRVIARRAMRRSLGNPKTRQHDLAAFAAEVYNTGIQHGAQYRIEKLLNSTASLQYELPGPANEG